MGRRGEREWGGGGECTRRVRENVLQMVEMWPFAAMIAKKTVPFIASGHAGHEHARGHKRGCQGCIKGAAKGA